MKRTRLDSMITEKTLRIINGSDNAHLVDLMQADPDYQLVTKNVCAKVSPQLSDKIDEVCGFLTISKRAFIEAALIQAVDQAEDIMNREGLFDHLQSDKDDEEKLK